MGMEKKLDFKILPQPNEDTCGQTCLQSIYHYYDDFVESEGLLKEIPTFKEGGTDSVFLACHALRKGYKATIYTYNLQLFDPTWFQSPKADLCKQLQAQMEVKENPKIHQISKAYLDFFDLGGKLLLQDLTTTLVRKYLKQEIPILTGLSSTYLYRSIREYGKNCVEDGVKGEPTGHFVVLCGYEKEKRNVLIADPLESNPMAEGQYYRVGIERVLGAILLGILTYDANLLIIEPRKKRK